MRCERTASDDDDEDESGIRRGANEWTVMMTMVGLGSGAALDDKEDDKDGSGAVPVDEQ